MPMSQLLIDLDSLLSASPSQCAAILSKWPACPKQLIELLDWQRSPDLVSPSPASPRASQAAEQASRTSDGLSLFSDPSSPGGGRRSKGFFDLDSSLDALGSRNELDLFLQPLQPSSQQEDVFAGLLEPAGTGTAAASSAPSSQAAVPCQTADSEPIPLLSSRILEALLHHALVHVKDGWVHWRDTLLFLRLSATAEAVPAERYLAVRRELFVGLLQRLAQSAGSDFYLSTGAVSETLRGNVAHLIDIMEDILYFQELRQPSRAAAAGGGRQAPQTEDSDLLTVTASSAPSSLSPEPSASLSRSTDDGDKADSWMLVTEEDVADILSPTGSGASPLPSSPSFSAITGASTASGDQVRHMRHEWVLVNQLLQCVFSLSFPLQPHRQLSARPESNSFFDALKSSGDDPLLQPVRAGGPLRVVLRFLLDCIASVTASVVDEAEQPKVEQQKAKQQLERMLSSLKEVCSRELSPAPSAAALKKDGDKAAERTWRNRYGLLVLARLSAMLKAAPESLRPVLSTGCRQLVDVLQPFSLVSALNFVSGSENADGQDRIIYVPVMVSPAGQLDISPSFNFQLSSSAAEIPGASTLGLSASSSSALSPQAGGMSAELLAAHRRVQESMSQGAQTRLSDSSVGWAAASASAASLASDDIFFSPATGLPSYSAGPASSAASPPSTRSLAALYPSSFTEPHASPSYSRVLRGCLDYVSSCVRLVSTAETRFAAEYALLAEKTRQAVLSRLRSEREQWRRLSEDLLRSAARVLQAHQYTEANRKAVVDALVREQQREVAEWWRSFQWSLFVEGSAWLPSSMIGKRRYWQVDSVEQSDNRMRRKLRQFHDGTDLRQATQTFLAEQERLRDRQVKATKTPGPAVRRKRVAAAGAVRSASMGSLTATEENSAASAALAALPAPDGKEAERKDGVSVDAGDAPAASGLGEVLEALETEAVQDGGEEDIAQMQSTLSQLSDKLNLKKIGGGEEEEEKEAVEQEFDDNAEAEAEAEAETHAAADAQPPTASPSDDGGTDSSGADGRAEDGAASTSDADWDLLADPNPDLNRPVISTNLDSYTSLNVMLVLPFTTVMGSLEMGSRYLQFVPNLNAEMTDRNGNVILEKGGEGKRVWTLPGLDTQRKRAKKTRQWELREVIAVYRRRYQLQKTALELFLSNGRNYFLDFGSREERRLVLAKLLSLKPPRLQRLLSRPAVELMQRSKLTQRWQRRELSNFEYLMQLNTISGRTYNDLNQFPVFPWVLRYFPCKGEDDPDINVIHVINSEAAHPQAPLVFRDLRRPIGALDAKRLEQILERFRSFQDDKMPGFMYGSHYSNAGIVMYYLLRLEPYASLHVEFQAGKFDFPDRLFHSVGQTWKTCLNSLSCYKELTPEFYYLPAVLDNINGYDLGLKQDGEPVGNVVLPSWAADSAEFIRIHRLALESEYVSANLHHWVDLIFGYKQQGKPAIDAHNLFFHLTYEGAVDLATITDPVLKNAVKDQVQLFGQCPVQLFRKPHPPRGPAVVTKLERLRLANPQYHATVQQPGYLHAHVKRMVLADRSSVVCISCVGQKVFTISANFTVAVHWWQPYQQDDYVERKADGSSKRVHLPFTHALAALERVEKQSLVTPQHVLFSCDGKLLFEVNNWDDSLRVYAVQSAINTEQLKLGLKDRSAAFGSLSCTLMQHLRQHKGRITCISLGKDERTLVTGSSDCTLLVWQLEYEEAANKIAGLLQEGKTYVRGEPRHRLRGHEDEVVAVAVQSELDVCVSVSARGLVLLHSLMKGWFLLRIRVPTAHELRAAAIAAAPASGSDSPALSEHIAAEELLRGQGSVDQPLAVDYGLDEYGKDSIAGLRRQAASSTSPRSAHMQSSEPDFLSSPPSASSSFSSLPPPLLCFTCRAWCASPWRATWCSSAAAGTSLCSASCSRSCRCAA